MKLEEDTTMSPPQKICQKDIKTETKKAKEAKDIEAKSDTPCTGKKIVAKASSVLSYLYLLGANVNSNRGGGNNQ